MTLYFLEFTRKDGSKSYDSHYSYDTAEEVKAHFELLIARGKLGYRNFASVSVTR